VPQIAVARKVALVDAATFPELYSSVQTAGERADLTGAASHSHDDETPFHACVVEGSHTVHARSTAAFVHSSKCADCTPCGVVHRAWWVLVRVSHSRRVHRMRWYSCVVERPVVELLMAQIETADVILANK
jgi:G3E family GTPase